MSTWTLTDVSIPSTLDAEDAEDFRITHELSNAVWRTAVGSDLLDEDIALAHQRALDQSYRMMKSQLLRLDGEPRGMAGVSADLSAERSAEVWIDQLGDLPQDAEDALFAAAEDLARGFGRTVWHAFSGHRVPQPGEAVFESPAGPGSIPRDALAERMLRHGYRLGQVERVSQFDLTADPAPVHALLDTARAHAADYDVVWWSGPTPEHHIEGYSVAVSRLGSDMPAGELDIEPYHYGVDRIRTRDQRIQDAGSLLAVTLVIHRPSGEVAGYNELLIERNRTRPTQQAGTLVVPNHRGHRLGAILKCEGILRWRELVPESPSIYTFNAEENRYMLSVNEAVGFREVARAGAWQKGG